MDIQNELTNYVKNTLLEAVRAGYPKDAPNYLERERTSLNLYSDMLHIEGFEDEIVRLVCDHIQLNSLNYFKPNLGEKAAQHYIDSIKENWGHLAILNIALHYHEKAKNLVINSGLKK